MHIFRYLSEGDASFRSQTHQRYLSHECMSVHIFKANPLIYFSSKSGFSSVFLLQMSLDLTYDLQCESGGNTLDPRPLLERPLLVRRVNM